MGLYVETGLYVEDLFTEKDDIFVSFMTKLYVCETINILRIFWFTKFSGSKTVPSYRLSTFVPSFFIRTTKIWLSNSLESKLTFSQQAGL